MKDEDAQSRPDIRRGLIRSDPSEQTPEGWRSAKDRIGRKQTRGLQPP